MRQHTLGKNERLKSRKLIEQLFKGGRSFANYPFRVYYLRLEGEGPQLQFGIGVSAKFFKRAVDRNRIKRLVREAYRLQKAAMADMLVQQNKRVAVFFIYTGKELPDYKSIFEKTTTVLEKLVDLVSK